jgi:hypothetical protein
VDATAPALLAHPPAGTAALDETGRAVERWATGGETARGRGRHWDLDGPIGLHKGLGARGGSAGGGAGAGR